MANLRLCYITCYQASREMLTSLSIPKERTDGYYEVKCMISAFNLQSKQAFIYAEFGRVKQNLLERALEAAGATSVRVDTFSPQDFISGARKALDSVREKGHQHGYLLIERGEPALSVQTANVSQQSDDIGIPVDYVKELEVSVGEAEDKIQAQNSSKIQALEAEADQTADLLRARSVEVEIKNVEIARLKEEHGAKDEEIARLKEDYGAKDEEIARLKEENGAKGAENLRLKKELGAKDEELARLKVQIEEAKSSSARTVVTANLRMEVHVLEEKVSKYCRENQTLLAEKTRIVQESWDRKTRVEELTRQLAGERESNLNVQNAMDEKHRKEVEALRRQISATKPEHYDQRMAEVTAELGAANRQLDLVRAEVARLRSSGEVRVVNKVVEVEQVFDKLLEMAQSMSQLGDNGGGEIDSGFQNLAKEAMLMLLSGTPGSKSDHLNKAQPIVDRFWSVYTKAARNEQEARTPYVRPQDLMTKQRKRKGDASL